MMRRPPANGIRAQWDNGDDAAAITLRQAPVTELYTTDTMVDGVHFTAATTPWRDLGWKAMASNISDIAAMGGTPGVALVTLGLPPDTAVPDIKEMYAGMMDICRQYQARIIGGDVVRSPVCFVTVALTGFARHRPLTRTAARPGHQVAVSGPVGGSAGGLRTLLTQTTPAASATDAIAAATAAELIRCHRRPQPHIAAGQKLAAAAAGPSGSAATDLAADIATATDIAAMDISDGLADDLGKLCAASGVAAVINADNVPAPPAPAAGIPRRLAGSGPVRRRGLCAAVHRPAGGDGHRAAAIAARRGGHRRHNRWRAGAGRYNRWQRRRPARTRRPAGTTSPADPGAFRQIRRQSPLRYRLRYRQ